MPVKAAPLPLNDVAETVPVLGLYVKSPSDSSPTFPVAEAFSINGTKLFSFVDGLSATETWFALVAVPVKSPTKVVYVVTPVAKMSPSLLNVIPLPTTMPFLAVTKPTASILVTSS